MRTARSMFIRFPALAAGLLVAAVIGSAAGWMGAAAAVATAVAAPAAPEEPESLTTAFERSGGLRTDRYDETVAFCRQLAASSPYLNYETFGTSPQGRDLPLLIADDGGRVAAEAVRSDPERIVVLVQACIHAGESCGKDAGLLLLRDAFAAGGRPAWLDRLTLLFVPIFNVDGHERFGPYNRANQNGPQEMGWRVTAANLNLNRDHLKAEADTPEMRAWLRLWNLWLPDFFVDTHSTDGADYQYAITYAMETCGNLDAGLSDWCGTYLAAMNDEMAAAGFPTAPYVSFKKWHDPRSGLKTWVAGPRYSQGYVALQNRPGLLIEAHMLKPYATRVEGTRALLAESFDWLADRAGELRALNRAADQQAASPEFRSTPFPLRFALTEESEPLTFAGVEYEEVTSEITGGKWYRYHGDQPVTMEVDFYGHAEPSVTVALPEAYLIPPEWSEVIGRLQDHGVQLRFLREAREVAVRSYRFSEAEWRQRPYEGHHPVKFQADSLGETRLFPVGSAVVDMNQRAARVAAHALEPDGPDSFVQWGFFGPTSSSP